MNETEIAAFDAAHAKMLAALTDDDFTVTLCIDAYFFQLVQLKTRPERGSVRQKA
jgi:hypothetical protein